MVTLRLVPDLPEEEPILLDERLLPGPNAVPLHVMFPPTVHPRITEARRLALLARIEAARRAEEDV